MDFSKCALGIEFGSTRIKGVLIDDRGKVLAQGSYDWENQFVDGIWTYSIKNILIGLKSCYKSLSDDAKEKYNSDIVTIGAIGISAMMHGYMVFDDDNNILVPFRTWRNNNAEEASKKLTELFNYPIPARWSIAHLYQAILNKEEHINKIKFQTTLEGYIHYLLTGEKVIGIGEASGMFPIDSKNRKYDEKCLNLFNNILKKENLPFALEDIFPSILLAGENAGYLTKEGALLLDPTGKLKPGVPFCPPEGDAGTGMVATNSVKPGTGNVSAGTSIFGMMVLKDNLKDVHREIDLVTTPLGDMVAMVHCNNCSSDINAWFNLFNECSTLMGTSINKNDLYEKLFKESLNGNDDCSDVLSCNYLSGENITSIENGRPIVVRKTESEFNLSNFVRSLIYSSFATLKIGFDILFKQENVISEEIFAHGGLFKTAGVAQEYLAGALNSNISVMENAGEGGAWGMAILALLILQENRDLNVLLSSKIFENCTKNTVKPDKNIVKGFNQYIKEYKKVIKAEKMLSEEF